MYAIVDILSKQYKVEAGNEITVDRISMDENSAVEFTSVLFVHDGTSPQFGTPYLPVAVKATVLRHEKGKKIMVKTYKRRKDYHRTVGHRTAQTVLRITEIAGTS